LQPMDERDELADASVFNSGVSESGRKVRLKERLLATISAAGSDEVATMLDRLWSLGEFRVQQAPRLGLVMYTMRDPFDTPFHLGEVLVSEAEVGFDGQTGYGVVCGDEPERALLLAAVEAAERSGRTAILGGIGELLGQLAAKSADQKALASRLAAATGVRFESMKKETVDFGSLGG
jgi:alpha-D-ribose 1-methylphosphonate 5-triphosphate synthase subunit PhnG